MKYLLIALITSSIGCATTGNLQRIMPGMTRDQVRNELGEPYNWETIHGKDVEVYKIRRAPKAIQYVLFLPTFGGITIPSDYYRVEYDRTGQVVEWYQ